MKNTVIILALLVLPFISRGQKRVTFLSCDSLEITADLYKFGRNTNYAIFFHQAGSSRGEYKDIAPQVP